MTNSLWCGSSSTPASSTSKASSPTGLSARERENKNPIRDGLGIVRAQVKAYGQCYANLVQHDPRFPKPDQLLARTVAGYDDTDDGVNLILRAVDGADPRSVWFCNWGTDHGSAASSLKRALDRVLRERGHDGYAKFKSRLRLSSYDAFGEHTTTLKPPFRALGGHIPSAAGREAMVSPVLGADRHCWRV